MHFSEVQLKVTSHFGLIISFFYRFCSLVLLKSYIVHCDIQIFEDLQHTYLRSYGGVHTYLVFVLYAGLSMITKLG